MSKITSVEHWYKLFESKSIAKRHIIKQMLEQCRNATLEVAAEKAMMKFHDGHFKKDKELKYFQSGSDNLTISKPSILSLISSEDLKVE